MGQVCSIVLDFQPNNVKALYRRAMAAVELGRHEWAYWDLVLAAEINPKNQEIVKLLGEVKDFICKKKAKDQTQTDCPKGLGLGLPPSTKKPKDDLRPNISFNQDNSQEKDPIIVENKGGDETIKDMGNAAGNGSFSGLENMKYEGYSEVSEDNLATVFSKKDMDEKMEDAGRCLNTSESSSTVTDEVHMISSVCSNDEVKFYPAEPRYRFNNRKRQGSKLTISSSDYFLMTQGKTLKFFNAKLGSIMEVKIANKSNEQAIDKGEIQGQEKVCPINGGTRSSLKVGKQDNFEKVHSEVDSCLTSDDDRQNSIEDGEVSSSYTKAQPQFNFSTYPNVKARRKFYDIKTYDSSKTPAKGNKRRKMQSKKNVPLFPDNLYCGCRYEVGQKRKGDHLLPMDFNFLPRKKFAPRVSWSNQCLVSPCNCRNVCNTSGSIKDVASVTHDSVDSHG